MRLVTWNILCGGRPIADGPDRLSLITDVLAGQNAQIIALQECVGFDAPGGMERMAASIGLPHFALARGAVFDDGLRYGTAVFSAYPIVAKTDVAPDMMQSAALHTVLATPDGDMAFSSVHLHAYDEDARLTELAEVLATRPAPADAVIAGDFNALARSDDYDVPIQGCEMRFDVVDEMLDAGFADVGHGRAWTHPSPIAADHTFGQNRRIDYVFATPALAARAARVEVLRTAVTDVCSDHYPVVAQFDLT